ncbi:ribosomal lysine n-methyltransferase set10 [Acrodontium crateriforme]|uniref:Ribosomal lysine n-methyltransferase set10 n=1 Tax=Acrodontium crateriforme TaxID=150365 RepID=A0AAQ3R9L5_9PEZI|nr:ribosomal lysine n-methyltransferase set10 [Acrodontium crateriforme]
MDKRQSASDLEAWFRTQNGSLHPDIHVSCSKSPGLHFSASNAIPAGSTICEAPHSISLSYLNGLVDDKYPVFQTRKNDFAIEAIGFWYLMAQYINRATSFWRPYLETLPPPEEGIPTALAFLLNDASNDREWLEGTDVLHTAEGRFEVYERYYATGIVILREAGIDTEPFTWHLFLWAVSMFTSRSFSSRALRPVDGNKYWATYKDSPTNRGRRQTVLLDMSHTPAADLDFPVLFPVLDAGNHDPKASAEWNFEQGRFGLVTHDSYAAGDEVFNNYGSWKPNAELLMGYGFCIPNNEADHVLLTPKAPSDVLQNELRAWLPGYFAPDGTWWSAKATFNLPLVAPPTAGTEMAVFDQLPEPLLEILIYILRHESELPFAFIPNPREYLTDSSFKGNQYLPFVARALVGSLAPKIAQIQPPTTAGGVPKEPANNRQHYAAIYCAGQMAILQSLINALRAYTRSLLGVPAQRPGPRFVTLEGLLEWTCFGFGPSRVQDFLSGIKASSGSDDMDTLRAAGWEDDVFVLLLCAIYLWSHGEGGVRGGIVWPEWMDAITPAVNSQDTMDVEMTGETGEQAQSLLALVFNAAREANNENSFWADARWTPALVARIGGGMIARQSMTMMLPSIDGGPDEARLVVYLHVSAVEACT